MNWTMLAGSAFAVFMCLATFWPGIWRTVQKLFAAAKSNVVPLPTLATEGGDPSRTAAINGVLAARDYAHAQGKHDVCHALEQALPGLVCDHPEKKA
jgi:hypothetical protein